MPSASTELEPVKLCTHLGSSQNKRPNCSLNVDRCNPWSGTALIIDVLVLILVKVINIPAQLLCAVYLSRSLRLWRQRRLIWCGLLPISRRLELTLNDISQDQLNVIVLSRIVMRVFTGYIIHSLN